MLNILKNRDVKILLALIILITIINLLLTLPKEINKRSIYDDITSDIEILNILGIESEISIDTRYKFNLRTSDQELNILKNISENLTSIMIVEGNSLKGDLSILDGDLESLEKQILLLGIEEELFNRDELNQALNYFLDESDKGMLRDRIRDMNENIIQGNEALLRYRQRINELKEQEKNANRFHNDLWDKSDSDIELMIKDMSLDKKVGQLFMWGIIGQSLNSSDLDILKEITPGGIILMGYNIGDENQTKTLTKSIQASNPSLPFFIATDQEGGPVRRIWWEKSLGATYWDDMSNQDVCDLGKERSNVLLNAGINVNLAPVVDLSYQISGFINHRTISSDPSVVSEKAGQFIECSQSTGLITTLKHFPGHGATGDDSHYTLPIIDKSKEQWQESDAIPFKDNLDSKMIMIGHLLFKNIDTEPATTSHVMLNDILRIEMGYEGIIISDDMNQLETSTNISTHDAVLDSLNAGIDIVLYVGTPLKASDMIAIVTKAVENGEVNEDEIDMKLTRILRAKRELH